MAAKWQIRLDVCIISSNLSLPISEEQHISSESPCIVDGSMSADLCRLIWCSQMPHHRTGTNMHKLRRKDKLPNAADNLKPPSKSWLTSFPCLLAMSISNSGEAQEFKLSQEEQILHHHAAMVKRDLEAYRTYFRSQEDWNTLFKTSLARFILAIHFYRPFSVLSRRHQWTFLLTPLAETQTSPFVSIRYYYSRFRKPCHAPF